MARRQLRGVPQVGAGGGHVWRRPPRPADRPPALGVDVGGVIVARASGDADTSFFGTRPMETPAVEGAIQALREFAQGDFEGRVYLVSKAGPKIESRTREWFRHVDFHRLTAIPAAHVHFVRERADKEAVCRRLGVTHFVDDRLDVLDALGSVPHRYLFLGGLGQDGPPAVVPADVRVASTWAEVVRLIRLSLGRQSRSS